MDIQAKMGAIFERVIPEEWRREISGIAKKASQIFANNLRGAHREDGLIELVYEAFRTMNDDETFDFPRKAGNRIPSTPLNKSLCPNLDLDWPSLKPGVQREFWNLEALGQPINDHDVVDRSDKRQRGGRPFPSPVSYITVDYAAPCSSIPV